MNKYLLLITAVLDTALILQLVQMTFAVFADSYISAREKKILVLIGASVLILLVQGHVDYAIGAHLIATAPHTALIATAVSVLGYILRPVLIILFLRLTRPEAKQWPLWTLAGINAAVYMCSFFSHAVISFDDNASFARGPLGYTCFFVSAALLFILIRQSVAALSRFRRIDMVIPIFTTAVIIAAAVLDLLTATDLPVSFLMAAISNGCVFYYLWLHLKFAREHERALLAESRIQIMMSQIQPHFLYNTLASIQALCATDPARASRTVEIFANYLRQNLESLGENDLIPLRKELEHTKIYTEIELLMFPEILIEYQTYDQSFMLPPLTIQPLVENSIRHGVRGVKDPMVNVITRREENDHVIIIKDNGRGFDASDDNRTSGKHIGIRNVRERIEKMCGGSLDVSSSPGNGCTVTIRIPVKRENPEADDA